MAVLASLRFGVMPGARFAYKRLLADNTKYIVTGGGSSILHAAGEMRSESQVYDRRCSIESQLQRTGLAS